MENLYPILIVSFSIAMAITMIIKIANTYKYTSIKQGVQHDLLRAYLMFAFSCIMIWFPIFYKGNENRLKKIAKRINALTVVFYLVVVCLATIIYFHIRSL